MYMYVYRIYNIFHNNITSFLAQSKTTTRPPLLSHLVLFFNV